MAEINYRDYEYKRPVLTKTEFYQLKEFCNENPKRNPLPRRSLIFFLREFRKEFSIDLFTILISFSLAGLLGIIGSFIINRERIGSNETLGFVLILPSLLFGAGGAWAIVSFLLSFASYLCFISDRRKYERKLLKLVRNCTDYSSFREQI